MSRLLPNQGFIRNREQIVAIYAAIITFLTYAAVYAFRKPFTVGNYSQAPLVWGMKFKDALVISQVLGYMLSKFFGIKFIGELKHLGRGKLILILVGISWLSLFAFAVTPPPYNIVFLFTNGFPLGIIWGIVFSFVEGRRATDFIGASLAVSFIFSSGFVKSVAQYLRIDFHASDWYLPFLTGLVFILPLLLFVYLLEKIPEPTPEDMEARVIRLPMDKGERKSFVSTFGTGLTILVILYVFLTVFRDIRDNFAADIWRELGFGNQPDVFTSTEIPITLIVLVIIASMILIKNNRRAFVITHYLIMAGFLISGISSWMFVHHQLSAFSWMTLVGLGLYMGYIPFNCILFDRMIATFKVNGNVGFLIYIADAFGYLGSVAVIISKSLINSTLKWATLYSHGVIYLSVVGVFGTLVALLYFTRKFPRSKRSMAKEPDLVRVNYETPLNYQ